LSRTQVSILDRLHTLQSIQVGSVMVPRSKTVMLPADATRAQIQRIVRATRVSRIPVYQGERRRVVGVAHLLDLLTADPDSRLSEQTLPPLEVSPDMPVTEALSTLQRRRRRMAIAVDKWGHCIGIVTVKDLVEEIVGELAAW
jgi:putative hemolysin